MAAGAAVATAAGAVVAAMPESREITKITVGDDRDVAAATAVPTIGTAARHMRLAAETGAAVAPRSSLDVDGDPVVEHQRSPEPPELPVFAAK
jgi:hypothetical protein